MSNFKIGEKVVCIDDSSGKTTKTKTLIKGQIYTVSGFSQESIFLVEVPTITHNGKLGKPSYGCYRFRKLDHQFSEDLCKQLIEEFQTETIYN